MHSAMFTFRQMHTKVRSLAVWCSKLHLAYWYMGEFWRRNRLQSFENYHFRWTFDITKLRMEIIESYIQTKSWQLHRDQANLSIINVYIPYWTSFSWIWSIDFSSSNQYVYNLILVLVLIGYNVKRTSTFISINKIWTFYSACGAEFDNVMGGFRELSPNHIAITQLVPTFSLHATTDFYVATQRRHCTWYMYVVIA